MINYEIKIWNGERLEGPISFDTETDIQPFHTRDHKLVTFQAYAGGKDAYLVEREDINFFLKMHKSNVFVAQNAPFDVSVLTENGYIDWDYWFYKIDNDKLHDTKLLYILLRLAAIGMTPPMSSLKEICRVMLGRDIDKNADIRCTFDQYVDRPYSEISEEHQKYALDDSVHTYDAYKVLLKRIRTHDTKETLLSHAYQIKGAIALDQIHKNGIGFDLAQKEEVLKGIYKESDILERRLALWGWVKGKPGNKGALFRALDALGILKELPLSPKSKEPRTGGDELAPHMDKQFVRDYLRFQEIDKAASFIRNIDSERIHPRYTTILNTGRTSCSGKSGDHVACNIQQLPRVGGIREVFIPKKDHVFVDIDYDSLELATLSQVLINYFTESNLADVLNEGKCPHVATAGNIYNKFVGKCTKQNMGEINKDERQFAKIANFGYPANMAPSTFVDYCKGYGVKVDLEQSEAIKEGWLKAYPEMRQYFDLPRNYIDGSMKYWNEEKGIWDTKDTYWQMSLTGRKRARCTYTAFLNTHFQGLAADGAKIALYESFKAGLKMVGFVHDAIIYECPKEDGNAVLDKASGIMVNAMQQVVPSITIRVEGEIKDRYSK